MSSRKPSFQIQLFLATTTRFHQFWSFNGLNKNKSAGNLAFHRQNRDLSCNFFFFSNPMKLDIDKPISRSHAVRHPVASLRLVSWLWTPAAISGNWDQYVLQYLLVQTGTSKSKVLPNAYIVSICFYVFFSLGNIAILRYLPFLGQYSHGSEMDPFWVLTIWPKSCRLSHPLLSNERSPLRCYSRSSSHCSPWHFESLLFFALNKHSLPFRNGLYKP